MVSALVELPPESQKPEESSPTREDHIATKFRYGGTQSVIPHYKVRNRKHIRYIILCTKAVVIGYFTLIRG